MKITYGTPRNGRVVFTVHHKFASHTSIDDQATMVVRRIINVNQYKDASDFEFYKKVETNQICGGRFSITERAK